MKSIFYVGFDVHKKTISYCIKNPEGKLIDRGVLKACRDDLGTWVESLDRPWVGALEATMFSGWVYDFLLPRSLKMVVAHPEMLKAISASKKKNDRLDAEKICDMLRFDLLVECYMAPSEARDLRRILRYRNLMVREAVRMKNKTAGLLMEVGVEYDQKRLHGKRYFENLLGKLDDLPDSIHLLLNISRNNLELFQGVQKRLLSLLRDNPMVRDRVGLLMTIPGVGQVTALTWVLEIGDPRRFNRISEVISYCGLCSAQKESGGKSYRGPISKKRNKHIQSVLIEAAKLAPRFNEDLALVHAKESGKGHRNRATLAVARKLATYMLAVDKRGTAFVSGLKRAAA